MFFLIIQTLKLIIHFNIPISEQQRENDRALRRASRDIERERRTLEVEENKIVSNCPNGPKSIPNSVNKFIDTDFRKLK